MAKKALAVYLFIISGTIVFGQQIRNEEILRIILTDSAFLGELTFPKPSNSPLIWIKELGKPNEECDNLIRFKKKIRWIPDGTGRVYTVVPDLKSKNIRLIREDSTLLSGYNHGAILYTFQDTIFSLGGYGFWTQNEALRFYDEEKRSWDVTPVNTLFPIGYYAHTVISGNQLFTGTQGYTEERLKSKPLYGNNLIMNFNLETKNWDTLGVSTPEFNRLGSLRLGAIGPRILLDFGWTEVALVDYPTNRILRLVTTSKKTKLLKFAHYKDRFVISSYRDSILTLINSEGIRDSIKLTIKDFKETGMKIYDPINKQKDLKFLWSLLISMTLIVGMISGYGFANYKTRSFANKNFNKSNLDHKANQSKPTLLEKEIIEKILVSENTGLGTIELDELLGNQNRTKEVQTQRRTLAVRIINQKFETFSGSSHPLIEVVRFKDDRRMIRYRINQEKNTDLNTWLKTSE